MTREEKEKCKTCNTCRRTTSFSLNPKQTWLKATAIYNKNGEKTMGVTAMSKEVESYLGKHYKKHIEVCAKTPSNRGTKFAFGSQSCLAKEAAPGLLKKAKNSKKAMETPRGYSVCKNVRYRCTKQVGYDGKTCDTVVETTAGFKKVAKDSKHVKDANYAETIHHPRSVKCHEFSIRRRNLIEKLVGFGFGVGTAAEDEAKARAAAEDALVYVGEGEGDVGEDDSNGVVEERVQEEKEREKEDGLLAGARRAVMEVLCPGPGPVSSPTLGLMHAAAQALFCPER